MNKKQLLKFAEDIVVCKHKEKVILGNTKNGYTFKLSDECFSILQEYEKAEITIEEFLSYFEDVGDKNYFESILELLQMNHILVSENSDEHAEFEVTIKLTNRCNLQCRHCCVSAGPCIEAEELTTDEWKAVLDQLAELNIIGLVFSGGEPLIRKDLLELAEYAKKNVTTHLGLMSNATLITEELAPKLVDLFESFSFSIDGVSEESVSPIRGKGTFTATMRGIELMKKYHMGNYSLSFTIVKQNEKYQDEFYEFATKLGATPMKRALSIVGRAKENLDLIPDEDRYALHATFSVEKNRKYYPDEMPRCISCGAFERKFLISEIGEVYPCPALEINEFALGNVREISNIGQFFLQKDYKSTKGYAFFRKMHPAYREKCKGCPVKLYCESCVADFYEIMQKNTYEHFCEEKRYYLEHVWE